MTGLSGAAGVADANGTFPAGDPRSSWKVPARWSAGHPSSSNTVFIESSAGIEDGRAPAWRTWSPARCFWSRCSVAPGVDRAFEGGGCRAGHRGLDDGVPPASHRHLGLRSHCRWSSPSPSATVPFDCQRHRGWDSITRVVVRSAVGRAGDVPHCGWSPPGSCISPATASSRSSVSARSHGCPRSTVRQNAWPARRRDHQSPDRRPLEVTGEVEILAADGSLVKRETAKSFPVPVRPLENKLFCDGALQA